MRNAKPYPKCTSNDIIRIPGTVGAYGSDNSIMVGLTIFTGPVRVTRYLCGACGFSEEWIDEAADIARIRKKYQP